jgi:complex iron-sulfur molybdoenzyme family reductase subunit gamma
MKRFIVCILFLGVFSSFVLAKVSVVRIPGNIKNIGVDSKAWLSARYESVTLYPKDSSIQKNKIVKIKALSDGQNLALLLKWKDKSKDIQNNWYVKDLIPDGYFLEFPVEYKDVEKLPYVDMGNTNREVFVYEQFAIDFFLKQFECNCDEIRDFYKSTLIASGIENIEEISDSSNMQMVYKDGSWFASFSRPLRDMQNDLNNNAFVLSIGIFDRDKKFISPWIGFNYEGMSGDDEFITALESKADGDIKNGERLALENCAACHRYKDEKSAPKEMAPNLSNVGGYSTKDYLIESLTNPSAVVVPKNNSDENNDFPWYSIGDNGEKISTMPSYDWMDEKSINDIVTFLQNLK